MNALQRTSLRVAAGLLSALLLSAAGVAWLNLRGEDPLDPAPVAADAAQAERGAYLARAGNCVGCHTRQGGPEYAGGRAIETPFGIVYASNITPDPATGIGRWSAAEFWRALHNGRSKDGRLLVPAFPYPNFTQVTRADADALYAYLMSRPAVRQPNRPHELAFPYDLQLSLAVWRALYFRAGVYEPRPDKPPAWNRGGYLVRGLGHCQACHAQRNLLGATSERRELTGGLIAAQNWYAPSLARDEEAGVAGWSTGEVVALLASGVSTRRAVMGPMAEVVFRSTQYLSGDDLAAMAVFLQDLPRAPADPVRESVVDAALLAQGETIYRDRCAPCHGPRGEGAAGAVPPLAGNRAVTMASPVNVVHAIAGGGFAPVTAGNPQPYGMPPFGAALDDRQIAAVASYIRRSWGNHAPPVSAVDVLHAR